MRSSFLALLALPLCLALAACGGEDGIPVTPTLGLEGPSSIRVIPGGTGSLDFVLQRNETATGEVRFDIAGLPEGVSATFEPAVLSGSAVATTLHLQARRDVERAGFLLTVRAAGPESLLAERQFLLDIRGLTVEGRVHSLVPGLAPAPMLVRIGSQTTLTAADGTFNVQDVAIPYDLDIDAPELRQRFLGLTTPAPVVSAVVVPPAGLDTAKEATIQGTVAPAPVAGERITVCASGPPEALAVECKTLEAGATAFELSFWLIGVETSAVRVIARRTVAHGSVLAGFSGYAEQPVTIASDRTSVAALNIADTSSTPVALALADHDFDDGHLVSRTSFGGHLVIQALDPSEPVAHVPANGNSYVSARAGMDDDVAIARVFQPITDATEVSVVVPRRIRTFGPPAGEAVTPGMTLGIEDPGPGINSFLLQRVGTRRLSLVHTLGDRVTLADFGEGELAERYDWAAYHDPMFETLDEMVEQGSSLSRFQALDLMTLPPVMEGPFAISYAVGERLGAISGAGGFAATTPRPGLLPAKER